MSTVSYLDHFLEPVTEMFTPALARKLVDLRAEPELERRIDMLRQKANEGTLTSEEDAEYKDFVEAVDVLAILQAKARQFLGKHPAWHGRPTRYLVWQRAGNLCEYCRIPQEATPLIPFHVEHIVARQHEGSDDIDNLALACDRCNAYKGPNLTSLAPDTGEIVPLCNPRQEVWDDHFRFDGRIIIGLTPIGQATVRLLNMNAHAAFSFVNSGCRRGASCERTQGSGVFPKSALSNQREKKLKRSQTLINSL